MTGPTHREYSVLFAGLTLIFFYTKGILNINYYLMIPIILTISKAGALFPDVDHAWQNVHSKTVTNKIINTLIHVTGGKHRSWQTHSIDICAAFTICSYIIPNMLYESGKLSEVNKELLSLELLAFASGWISHLFSDMLTSAGVRLVFWSKFVVKIVPKKIGKLRFNTGNEWERFNYKAIKIANIPLGCFVLIYPLIQNGTLQGLIQQFIK